MNLADSVMLATIRRLEVLGFDRATVLAAAEELVPIIKAEIRAAMPAALAETKAASEAGMNVIASATFVASMTLAGVAAADQWAADQDCAAGRCDHYTCTEGRCLDEWEEPQDMDANPYGFSRAEDEPCITDDERSNGPRGEWS